MSTGHVGGLSVHLHRDAEAAAAAAAAGRRRSLMERRVGDNARRTHATKAPFTPHQLN